MKRKPVYFSIAFLFIFLSSFSTNTYISIHNSIQSFYHFSKSKEVQNAVPSTTTEDLVFEETENDSEETLDPGFTLLPSFLNFQFSGNLPYNSTRVFSYIENVSACIFLSICVLRI